MNAVWLGIGTSSSSECLLSVTAPANEWVSWRIGKIESVLGATSFACLYRCSYLFVNNKFKIIINTKGHNKATNGRTIVGPRTTTTTVRIFAHVLLRSLDNQLTSMLSIASSPWPRMRFWLGDSIQIPFQMATSPTATGNSSGRRWWCRWKQRSSGHANDDDVVVVDIYLLALTRYYYIKL